jgi:type VI secretion system protein ImpA
MTSELLAPIDQEHSIGLDREDSEVVALEQLAKPRKKQDFVNDTLVWTDLEPDWRAIEAMAVAILGRSRDLRAAVRLAQSAAALRGMPDFAAALAVVRGLVERHWNSMHPVLEPDDDGLPDVIIRTGCVGHLADRRTTVKQLRSIPLFSTRQFGDVSLRTIELVEGRAALQEGEEPPSAEELAAAFADASPDEFRQLFDAAAGAIEHAVAIEKAFARVAAENRNAQHAIALDPLKEALGQIRKVAADHAPPAPEETRTQDNPAGTGPGDVESGPEDMRTEMPMEIGVLDKAPAAAAASMPTGEIRNRADVLKALDRICDYYTDHEPSSPVPLLLVRARGLVDKNFIDILKDLAPNGLTEASGLFVSRNADGGGDDQE